MPARKSKRGSAKRKSSFERFRFKRERAEREGKDTFTDNGKRYVRGYWDNGNTVWRRAARSLK